MAGAHLDVSIQDAIRNNADGALVCYTQLPAKYGDGFCEGVEVASKSAKDAIQSACKCHGVACSIKES